MKLLQPTQQNDARQSEVARDILRAKEAREIEQEWRIKLANAEADFNATLAKNRTQWEQEWEQHLADKLVMQKEIDELEAKRAKALVPIDDLERELKEKIHASEDFLLVLTQKNDDVETIRERLEDELDEVGQREQDVLRREHKAKVIDEQNKNDISMIQGSREQLIKMTADFKDYADKKQADLQKRETALILNERTIESRENKLMSGIRTLQEDNIRLADGRRQLRAAWAELEQKKLSP